MHDKIAVIDFGGQYAHLIARRIREQGVLTEIHKPDNTIDLGEYDGYILSGGPGSVYQTSHTTIVTLILETGRPILGICYGHQLLAETLGGHVEKSPNPEFGPVTLEIHGQHPILEGVPRKLRVWMSHNDAVTQPPPGATVHASTPGSPVAMFTMGDNIIGVQWHPEVTHTQAGMQLLDNYIKLTKARRTWTLTNILLEIKNYIQNNLPPHATAIAAVSGGIDSSLATYLAQKYSQAKIIPVFIDTGLLPEGERETALKHLETIGIHPEIIEAEDQFLQALKDKADPEEKRRVTGEVYSQLLHMKAMEHNATHLIQGTIYPDIIESGATRGADKIKTHHNVGGLTVTDLHIVEPLRNLYKDEVRRIARNQGFPKELIEKKPIPGPGLAVRIEGPITKQKIQLLRKADQILRETIEKHNLHKNLWQYFAILPNTRATGVKGDKRAYGPVIILRIVESKDAMTADIPEIPYPILREITQKITSQLPQITRVLYDITTKPPATIEWE